MRGGGKRQKGKVKPAVRKRQKLVSTPFSIILLKKPLLSLLPEYSKFKTVLYFTLQCATTCECGYWVYVCMILWQDTRFFPLAQSHKKADDENNILSKRGSFGELWSLHLDLCIWTVRTEKSFGSGFIFLTDTTVPSSKVKWFPKWILWCNFLLSFIVLFSPVLSDWSSVIYCSTSRDC